MDLFVVEKMQWSFAGGILCGEYVMHHQVLMIITKRSDRSTQI